MKIILCENSNITNFYLEVVLWHLNDDICKLGFSEEIYCVALKISSVQHFHSLREKASKVDIT